MLEEVSVSNYTWQLADNWRTQGYVMKWAISMSLRKIQEKVYEIDKGFLQHEYNISYKTSIMNKSSYWSLFCNKLFLKELEMCAVLLMYTLY